jgi:hypothetical protein
VSVNPKAQFEMNKLSNKNGSKQPTNFPSLTYKFIGMSELLNPNGFILSVVTFPSVRDKKTNGIFPE